MLPIKDLVSETRQTVKRLSLDFNLKRGYNLIVLSFHTLYLIAFCHSVVLYNNVHILNTEKQTKTTHLKLVHVYSTCVCVCTSHIFINLISNISWVYEYRKMTDYIVFLMFITNKNNCYLLVRIKYHYP